MQLQIFKTLWGHDGSFEQACQQAVDAGFDGIEGPAPEEKELQVLWQAILDEYDLLFIAEITTAGSYVPDRKAGLQDHLDSLQHKIESSLPLQPEFISSLAGCDAWTEEMAMAFFEQALQLEKQYQIDISFETHRSRCFFNPWVTERICQQLPELKLTCDFSHWCVVCERLFDEELEDLTAVFNQAFHIHGRVGYDQGPQVSDPASELYQKELKQHESWWHKIWNRQKDHGVDIFTLTPEFGPDGYQAINAKNAEPIGDLWAMNQWMAKRQRQQFEQFIKN